MHLTRLLLFKSKDLFRKSMYKAKIQPNHVFFYIKWSEVKMDWEPFVHFYISKYAWLFFLNFYSVKFNKNLFSRLSFLKDILNI